MRKCANNRFTPPTSFYIAIQLLDLLEKLHSVNFVHNDLKMENIVIGKNNPHKLYLIDFGMSQTFVDETGKHITKKDLGKFSGNFIFASLNSCRGYNKSRRDDLESLLYMLIYMLNGGQLPWSNFEDRFCAETFDLRLMLRERLLSSYTRRLFQQIPDVLCSCLKKVLLLNFDQVPNY
jgi:serine/threonine protein kinase